MLVDNHYRIINYLRLSVTDRCNLRCRYCLPSGIRFLPGKELLSDAEIIRLIRVLAAEGISKIRITGGEPFARQGLTQLLKEIKKLQGIETVNITTNGVLALPHLETLAACGIRDINLSIDTLRSERFSKITGRDAFDRVWETFEKCLALKMRLKINVVLMDGVNTDEFADFARLTAMHPVSIRFIEEMPFNGKGDTGKPPAWDHRRILRELRSFLEPEAMPALPGATAVRYRVKGYPGDIGIIPAYSRTFCGSCNRLRVTATGGIKTCLYGEDTENIRDSMRRGASDSQLVETIRGALENRHRNGWQAASGRQTALENMSAIGG